MYLGEKECCVNAIDSLHCSINGIWYFAHSSNLGLVHTCSRPCCPSEKQLWNFFFFFLQGTSSPPLLSLKSLHYCTVSECITLGCRGVGAQPHSLEWIAFGSSFSCQTHQGFQLFCSCCCSFRWEVRRW